MKRLLIVFFSLFFSVCGLFVTLPFSYAQDYFEDGIIYSKLPEPVPTSTTSYLLLTNSSNGNAYLYMFSAYHPAQQSDAQFLINRSSNGDFTVTCSTSWDTSGSGSTSLDWIIAVFSAKTGAFLSYYTVSPTQSFSFTNRPVYDSYIAYGCIPEGFNSLKRSSISWDGYTDHAFQDELISQALSQLDQTLYYISQDTTDLSHFTSDIRTYIGNIQDWLLNDVDEFIYWVKNTFSSALWDRLNTIQSKLDTIIDLLGGSYESTEFDQPSEQQQAIDDLVSAEAAVQGNVAGDMENAFGAYGEVFGGNGAFSMIKTGFESIVLQNTKLNALIIFALTLGVAVLLIGRKIKA